MIHNLTRRLWSLHSDTFCSLSKLLQTLKGKYNELKDLKNADHDSKHEKKIYYRLVFETLRGKLDQPSDQFRNFILPLLGDKDHEKVLDVVAKVEKSNLRQIQKSSGAGGVSKNRSYLSSRPPRRCFYCNKPGHIKAQCLQRKRDFGESNVLNYKKPPTSSNK